MQVIFVSIYKFFERNIKLYWFCFIGSFLLLIVLASQIKLKDDITSMLPDSKAIKAMNNVVSNTQAGEQLIFMLSFTDSSITNPDSLIIAADDYLSLIQKECAPWIDTIILQPSAGYEEVLVDVVQQNLPLFLNDNDYKRLDTLLEPERIARTLEQNKKLLLSPAGTFYKTLVSKDPVGISRLVWEKLKTLQADPGYETYEGYLFNNAQRNLSFFLKSKYKASETGKNADLFKKVDELTDTWQANHAGLQVMYFGGPAVAAGNATQLQRDTIVTLSITIVLLLILTYYFFRKKRTSLLLLVPVLYGAACGLAVMYIVQGSVAVIALGAGAIILGIAIDFAIHFLSHTRHVSSIRVAVQEMSNPLTIGSFTTVAAFLSLRFVSTPILQDLGLFAAASLAGASLCTLIFLPHLPIGSNILSKPTIFDKVGKWKPEKNKWLVIGIILLTPVMYKCIDGVSFDSDMMHLNYLSPKLQRAQDEVSKYNAAALSSVFVMASDGSDDHALQRLEKVNSVIDSLIDKGFIRNASNPTLLLPSLREQSIRLDKWKAYWTDERQNSVMSAVNAASVANGFSANAFSDFKDVIQKDYKPFDAATQNILASLFPGGFSKDGNTHYAIASLKVEQTDRQQVFESLKGIEGITITDRQQGASQLVEILNKDFTSIAIYSSLIVFFALLIGYGRIELAIIAFLPMAISWIWILGLMSLLGLQFNIVNIIISSLIFGLGDDYTIFTMDGLIEKYRTGKQKLDSTRAAVYVSVLTVIIGLGVLLLAKHPALRSIAFISVTGLVCVLFVSQVLQPFLFNWFIQNRADKKFLPFTLRSFCISVFAFAYFFTGSMVLTILGVILTKLWPFNKEKAKYWFHACVSRYTWSMMYIMMNVKKRVFYINKEDFQKPAVYIANHTSFLDILLTTMLHPKLVLMTNRWVWRSPVFGAVVRMAEYYPVADGAEESLEPLRDLVNRGYSIVVFPEGTRSYDDTINRFHKGAFFIAEKLNLDIVPILLHGVGYTMQKGDWLLKDGTCSIYIHNRIKHDDASLGTTYTERAKLIGRWMRNELTAVKLKDETPKYFKEQLIRSYTFKGPVTEWYCRIKTKLEDYYEPFHQLLPRKGKFYDLGCGYGFMTYMLQWAAPERTFVGVDYDADKIETAQGNFLRSDKLNFLQGDVIEVDLQPCDGIIISDMLHYLLPQQQETLLEKCYNSLNANGTLIIRDGVAELQGRIKGTKLTELFSTKLFKFNKTQNELHYISKEFIEAFAAKYNMSIEMLDNAKYTANLIFVLKKQD